MVLSVKAWRSGIMRDRIVYVEKCPKLNGVSCDFVLAYVRSELTDTMHVYQPKSSRHSIDVLPAKP